MIFRIPENRHRFMRLMNTNLKSSECTFLNQLQLGWNLSHFFICDIILFILCTNAPSINFYKNNNNNNLKYCNNIFKFFYYFE